LAGLIVDEECLELKLFCFDKIKTTLSPQLLGEGSSVDKTRTATSHWSRLVRALGKLFKIPGVPDNVESYLYAIWLNLVERTHRSHYWETSSPKSTGVATKPGILINMSGAPSGEASGHCLGITVPSKHAAAALKSRGQTMKRELFIPRLAKVDHGKYGEPNHPDPL
jgi:hypothetical protein